LLQNSMYVMYVYTDTYVCIYMYIYVYMCLYIRTRLKWHRNVKPLVYNARYAVVPGFSSLLTTTLCSSVITTLVYKPLHNVITELDCVYIFSNIVSCETNKSYMETRLYNDVGRKCCKGPEYYFMVVIAWNFRIDTSNFCNSWMNWKLEYYEFRNIIFRWDIPVVYYV
jgi:hypothetical protein